MLYRYISSLLTVLVLALAGYAFLNWQSSEAASSSDTLADTENLKPLYWAVGLPNYLPFTERDTQGTMIGMDVELLTAIAEAENIELTFRPHKQQGLLNLLDNGDADIVFGGVIMTPARQQKYSFTMPYLSSHWAVLVDKTQQKGQGWAQLQGKKILAMKHTAAEWRIMQWGGISKTMVDNVYLGANLVANRQASGILDAANVLKHYVQQNPNLTLLSHKNERISFAFAVKRSNLLLKRKLDSGLAKIRANGKYKEILTKYGQAS